MKKTSIEKRIKRLKKIRSKIKNKDIFRLNVHKTNKNIYAQVTNSSGSKVFFSVSTLSQGIKKKNNIKNAKCIGKKIGILCIKAGIRRVAFDRSGFKYHGKIKSIADGARKEGLIF